MAVRKYLRYHGVYVNYTANYDGVNGWYYQIGVIKNNFLDYGRYSNSLSSGC